MGVPAGHIQMVIKKVNIICDTETVMRTLA